MGLCCRASSHTPSRFANLRNRAITLRCRTNRRKSAWNLQIPIRPHLISRLGRFGPLALRDRCVREREIGLVTSPVVYEERRHCTGREVLPFIRSAADATACTLSHTESMCNDMRGNGKARRGQHSPLIYNPTQIYSTTIR